MENDTDKAKPSAKKGKLAKKDFIIHHNEHHYEIKKGDDLKDIPTQFTENLKTEGVI